MKALLCLTYIIGITLCVSKTITIDNTKPMLDTNGNIINVHEGHLVRWEENGLFYFYGMQYDLCSDNNITCGGPGCGWETDHNVTVYTSTDLSSGSWKYEGTIFDTTTPGRPQGTYFRMFIFYNKMNSEYVLWNMYNNGGYYISSSSSSPLGPFRIINKNIEMGHSGSHGDFYGYQDPSDDRAYIVYNTGGHIAVDELESDYLSSTKKTTPKFNISGWQEAPLMFKRNNIFYVLTGHGCCVCKKGSDANVWISKNGGLGPYKYSNNIGAYSNKTSRTQSQMAFFANIKQSNGDVLYLWSGDRWQQAPDELHGHDPQIWQPLKFNQDDTINNLQKLVSFQIDINVTSIS